MRLKSRKADYHKIFYKAPLQTQTSEPKPEPTTINEPLQRIVIELEIIPEPYGSSAHVCEPTTAFAMREFTVVCERKKGGSAHCTIAEDVVHRSQWCRGFLCGVRRSKEAVCELSVCPVKLSSCTTKTMEVVPLTVLEVVLCKGEDKPLLPSLKGTHVLAPMLPDKDRKCSTL
ncbi:hypothetical protein Q8A67_018157 [Cirrhinus molitorella]|uniref:Uncharacterized protein n=1 Tax=Cirrhinus molitorella TaxID=172907 RepID=A0AA88TIQ2_9TELE|nr:hypothetical protein Q8A67_018157 [Cirrhinus molitorella]